MHEKIRHLEFKIKILEEYRGKLVKELYDLIIEIQGYREQKEALEKQTSLETEPHELNDK